MLKYTAATLAENCRRTLISLKEFTGTLLLKAKQSMKYIMPEVEQYQKVRFLYSGAYFLRCCTALIGDLDRFASCLKRTEDGFYLDDLVREYDFCRSLTLSHVSALLTDAALFSSDEFGYWCFQGATPPTVQEEDIAFVLDGAQQYFSALTFRVNVMYEAATQLDASPRDTLESSEATCLNQIKEQTVSLRRKLKRY